MEIGVLISPIFGWRIWGSEKLSSWPEITQTEEWGQGLVPVMGSEPAHSPCPRKHPGTIQTPRHHVPETQSVPKTAAQGQIYYSVYNYNHQGTARTGRFWKQQKKRERKRDWEKIWIPPDSTVWNLPVMKLEVGLKWFIFSICESKQMISLLGTSIIWSPSQLWKNAISAFKAVLSQIKEAPPPKKKKNWQPETAICLLDLGP